MGALPRVYKLRSLSVVILQRLDAAPVATYDVQDNPIEYWKLAPDRSSARSDTPSKETCTSKCGWRGNQDKLAIMCMNVFHKRYLHRCRARKLPTLLLCRCLHAVHIEVNRRHPAAFTSRALSRIQLINAKYCYRCLIFSYLPYGIGQAQSAHPGKHPRVRQRTW